MSKGKNHKRRRRVLVKERQSSMYLDHYKCYLEFCILDISNLKTNQPDALNYEFAVQFYLYYLANHCFFEF